MGSIRAGHLPEEERTEQGLWWRGSGVVYLESASMEGREGQSKGSRRETDDVGSPTHQFSARPLWRAGQDRTGGNGTVSHTITTHPAEDQSKDHPTRTMICSASRAPGSTPPIDPPSSPGPPEIRPRQLDAINAELPGPSTLGRRWRRRFAFNGSRATHCHQSPRDQLLAGQGHPASPHPRLASVDRRSSGFRLRCLQPHVDPSSPGQCSPSVVFTHDPVAASGQPPQGCQCRP
nr:hypothetical protein CFP56_08098 [Quercus suber]